MVRTLFRRLIPIALVCVACALLPCAVTAQPEAPHTVLAIHWGPTDFPVTPAVNDAIRSALRQHDVPVDYFAEYLESDRVPEDIASQSLADFIRHKYQGRRIDLVFAVADPALRFALDRRPELFPGVPVIFSGVLVPDESMRSADGGLTAVLRGTAYRETLKLALDLQPSTEHVYVIARSRDRTTEDTVRSEIGEFSKRVPLTFVDEPSIARLLQAVKSIPPRSLILFVWFAPDDPGYVPNSAQIVEQLAEVSPVPIYGTNERYVGVGAVAGVVRGSRETGQRMGEMAVDILNGKRAQEIPIENARLVTTVDWRQIRRWGIDPSRLPADANIQFQTPTAWEAYRLYIIGTVIVVAAQLLLIAGLLTQRARRRRAEALSRESEDSLRTSFERIRQLTGRLINAQEAARADLARDLHDDVCQALAGVSMSVTSLRDSRGSLQDPRTQETLSKLQDEALAISQGIRRLSHELHPATLRLLGLAVALKAHCSEVAKRHGVQVNYRAEGDFGSLHPDTAVCLFRIAQESLRNGIVHGDALRLGVSLTRSGDYVEMIVADDGRGFDLEAVRRSASGLGLVSIEERARVVGGEVTITTGPRQGTTIKVRCPAREQRGLMAAATG